MAKKHFEEEEKPTISYATFVFMLIISFWLGMSIEAYHIKKQLPDCKRLEKRQENQMKLLKSKNVKDIETIKVICNESH